MNKLKVMSIFGTRPEAIKMAPVVLELSKYPTIESIVTVTAQHREMLDQVLNLFKIKPDFDLNIMSTGQTLFDITNRVLMGLDKILAESKPDIILVHGDTTTTFVGALAAYYHRIEVGHVEAGLRTNNKFSPYPEEMNRRLTGSLTDFHFAPTVDAKKNLLRENIDAEKIFVTGNTVIDALYHTVRKDFDFPNIDFSKRIILVTTHRRENLGEPMRQVYRALKSIVEEFSDVQIIFPVHKNPQVREVVNEEIGNLSRVSLIDPLDYEPFVNLMSRATLVLTDSGGVQEEAPALGKPVLVLRDTTERPEALQAGVVNLIGTNQQKIFLETKTLLTDADSYRKMSIARSPYGDGHAAERIVQAILWHHEKSTSRPNEFIQ